MEVPRDRNVLGDICTSQMTQHVRRAAMNRKDKAQVPRSSSPLTVYVELPCVIEQGARNRAFSTIAWDDFEECDSAVRRKSDSLGSQMNESEADDQDFGDYALDFMAESPTTLESSLSPSELVPFQGCVIPPLTPQPEFSAEQSCMNSFIQAADPPAQNGALWRGIAQCEPSLQGHSVEVNQLHEALHRRQEEIDSLQERNLHLRQLACRAKHLASVLEKLMTVREPNEREPELSCGDKPSLSPCKRQRLDEGYETESSDLVEDMLRDIGKRCNAVLHSTSTGKRIQQQSETHVRMFGAFSGLQMNFSKNSSLRPEGVEVEDSVSSFRTSVREHCTIRTQVFPHGRAFTSSTQEGGYRFRWVPNHS